VLVHPGGDLLAKHSSLHVRGPKVDPEEDARVRVLVDIGEPGVLTVGAGRVAVDRELDPVRPEEVP